MSRSRSSPPPAVKTPTPTLTSSPLPTHPSSTSSSSDWIADIQLLARREILSLYEPSTGTPTSPLATDTASPTQNVGAGAITSISDSTSGTGGGDAVDGGGDGAQGGLSVAVIVPIAVVLAVLVAVILALIFRTRLLGLLRRLHIPTGSHALYQPQRDASASASTSARNLNLSRTVTANELSGTPPRNGQVTAGGGGGGGAVRGRVRGPRGRALRRTESGRSIRTLPKYSKEAGDEELVLVRQRSQSTTYSEGSFSDDPDTPDEGHEPNEPGAETLLPTLAPIDSARTPTPRNDLEGGTERLLPESVIININDDVSPTSTPVPHTAPLPGTAIHDGGLGSIARRGWGEAPTYLEAMSSPSLPLSGNIVDLEAGVPPPRSHGQNQTLRTRTSSTFRDFLNRTGFVPLSLSRGTAAGPSSSTGRLTQIGEHRRAASSTSLLLQPQSSRRSSASPAPGSLSPYSYNSPSQSTHSLQLMISSPIPHTAIRASFDSTTLPKAGLSEQQMRFLSSSEAVNLAGLRLEDVPDYRKRGRRRSEAPSFDGRAGGGNGDAMGAALDGQAPRQGREYAGETLDSYSAGPPTWDQSQDERRRSEAWNRRNLARPAAVAAAADEPSVGTGGSGEQEQGRRLAGGMRNMDMDIPASQADRANGAPGPEGIEATEGAGSGTGEGGTRISVERPIIPFGGPPTFEVEPPTPVSEGSRSRVPSLSVRNG